MKQLKQQLENMASDLNSAIKNLKTKEQYGEWVVLFVTKVTKICLPEYSVSVDKLDNP